MASQKIELNTVASVLLENIPSEETVKKVIEELQKTLKEEKTAVEKEPVEKKQFVVLVSDPEGRIPEGDLAAWVIQIPESESPFSTKDRIAIGANDFNASKKGRKIPVRTIGEALENVPSRLFKEASLWVKTKSPVLVVRTDNTLPKVQQDHL